VIESFIKSNYQLIFWAFALVVAVIIIFWFIRRTSSKIKNKKETSRNLRAERKEMVLELVKDGEGMTEKEVSDFLGIGEEEAHEYLVNLIREERIRMETDIDQVPRYKSTENNG